MIKKDKEGLAKEQQTDSHPGHFGKLTLSNLSSVSDNMTSLSTEGGQKHGIIYAIIGESHLLAATNCL